MKINSIGCFDTFVLRTPLLPINFYTNLLNDYSNDNLFGVLEDELVKEAIKIASPELINEFEKLLRNPIQINSDKKLNLELALLKYIARLSSRATPFGIFAGCTSGLLSNETSIQIDSIEKYEVFTQFDMHYWICLLQDISKNATVQKNLIYYPNSSLYKIADFYRYIEYEYVNKKREHTLSSFRVNPVIDALIKNSKMGLKFNELIDLIIEDASEIEEASEFVLGLINNQILVSELDATITGNFDIKRVVEIIEKSTEFNLECNILKEMSSLLDGKVNLTDLINQFDSLKKLVEKFDTESEEKYILQTDLYKITTCATLNKKVSIKITKALQFLSKIRENKENSNLTNFKKTFQKRYETREMPLSVVLDSELGIGYLQNTNMNDTHSVLDKFSFDTSRKSNANSEEWTKVDYVLEKKLKETISNSQDVILLEDKDFEFIENGNSNMPDTFSVMVEIISKNEEEIISIESSGNYSAAKLIGRFCNGDEAIHNLANDIIKKETELNPNKILAEIVHMPQSRTGNVLRRPCLREYEIPYLANSILPLRNQITIEDLYVSIKNNKVVLKSMSLNKEIIPCLSNAHNYTYNSLPIYHFLCDLQGQSKNPISGFNWGVLEKHYSYFPRVIYSGVVISKAKWIFEYIELEKFIKVKFTSEMRNQFSVWKEKMKIPQYVNLVNGDNTLLLDLNVEIGITLFLKTIKPNLKIILEEFLFEENSVVKDENSSSFANQFILSFFKSNKNE
ncbi:lantibiotic dehydratase family protein [Flavobacterium facile]|uniref:lantibiotic dehydratase family protein n=1 Tax=Flavobacterium facile TaxID=2893174 RepID=UPI002E79691B|nr:lantibiotic dehydratase family protein [Flavobacterium sp. T-12]